MPDYISQNNNMRKKYFDGPPTPSTHPKILAKNMYLNIKTCFKVVVDSYFGGGVLLKQLVFHCQDCGLVFHPLT